MPDTQRSSHPRSRRRPLVALLASVVVIVAFAPIALADSAQVTRGDVHPFAAGADLQITGRAQMVRTADNKTIVSVHLEGLGANTTYPAHVHAAPCGVNAADGHYKFDGGGAAEPPNEIWPGFTTNGAGVGNGNATADARAGETAVSVVVHDPITKAKIACADLG
ncbi:MAG: hypothetical protein HYX55_02460 [Chloroflexi bacterium]|nr:hypothetical protein [Chloroflexota bacterium]